ncbi:MAG TPA: Gfo/Idh/MocA family oxidoreductase, partial [Desulfosarcina sp.]|nr:Gfo/Idh/MocA family oxidoreductase [Desulfosarcina sp.]
THAGMYRSLDAFDLVAAAEVDSPRRQAFQRFWQVPQMFAEHRRMLALVQPDILSVATPDETHEEIIGDALRCEKPPRLIFCEKPLAQSVDRARELCREAGRRRVTLCVDYVRRWDENHRRLKDWIREGGLGSLEAVNGCYVRGLSHNGCQMINLIRYLFGPVDTVRACGPAHLGSFPGDPSLDLCMMMESGLRVHLTGLDQGGYGFSIFELDIFGQKGRVRIVEGGQQAQVFMVRPDPQFPNFCKLHPVAFTWDKRAYGQALIGAGRQMAAFLSGGGELADNQAEEALADLMVIEAARASALSGGTSQKVNHSPQ